MSRSLRGYASRFLHFNLVIAIIGLLLAFVGAAVQAKTPVKPVPLADESPAERTDTFPAITSDMELQTPPQGIPVVNVQPGQVQTVADVTPTQVTIQPGQTLSQAVGPDWPAWATHNKLSNANLVYPGQVLYAPNTAIPPNNAQAPPVTKQTTTSVPTAGSSKASQAVAWAMAQRGKPYVWGASGPNSFDCSGLVMAAYKSVGISLPRTSNAQSRFGTPVSKANLQPGDLVFFYSPVSHVAMYIGDGNIVQAQTSGQPVKVTTLAQGGPFHNAMRVA